MSASDDVKIRSHIEYLVQTYYNICSFCSRNWWKI